MLLFLLYLVKYALSYLLHRVSIIFHRLHPVLAHSVKETLQRVAHFLFHNRKNLDSVVLLSYIYLRLPQRKPASFYLCASGGRCLKHHVTPNVLIGLADILKNLLKHLHFVILLINCYPFLFIDDGANVGPLWKKPRGRGAKNMFYNTFLDLHQ